jgi:serine/threonine protein kinase
LAREYENTYNPQSSKTIPVRWSAPEVLTQQEITTKSNVFSFGVCMWEILENGTCKNHAKRMEKRELILSKLTPFLLLFL